MMEFQTGFNIFLGIVSFGGGWLVNRVFVLFVIRLHGPSAGSVQHVSVHRYLSALFSSLLNIAPSISFMSRMSSR